MDQALRWTEQKFLWRILIWREPELGLRFWLHCLTLRRVPDRAIHAVTELASANNGMPIERIIEAVQELMEHSFSSVHKNAVCKDAARLLAQLSHEAALPCLLARMGTETDAEVLEAFELAVGALESAPPPPLNIRVLGEFSVTRGNHSLAVDDWHRPAVRRLFQYFVLHAGQPLSRDRILDDLWSDSEPGTARNTFRTLFSWLRRTLDPHLRPKATARYFQVAGEVYTFAPPDVAPLISVDKQNFESTVETTLAQTEQSDLPHLPSTFLAALESWSPLLPELPYEPWAVTARERVAGLYVEGCLHAAQSLLHLQRTPEAARWAHRAIEVAPWLEEAYQALMRAQARQGQRSLALRTYAEAVDALERELDVPPAALTEWLAQRLRQGEEI